MKEIPLRNKNKEIIGHTKVSDEDYENLSKYKWHDGKGYPMGWVVLDDVRKKVYMHHMIVGNPDPGYVTDHIDHDPMNNTRENLRNITFSHNSHNRHYKIDVYRGVTKTTKKRWSVNVQNTCYGYFDSVEEAGRRYDICAYLIYGKGANTNGLVTFEEAQTFNQKALELHGKDYKYFNQV